MISMRFVLVSWIGLVAMIGGCKKDPDAATSPAAPLPVPVTVATALQADVPIEIRSIGAVESKAVVSIRPQIAGRIVEITAIEGTDVEANQVLVRLDPRPFQAVLDNSLANLAKATTMAQDAHRFARRIAEATTESALTGREAEEAAASAAAADAEVASLEARVAIARLDLEYCTIVAPFAGRLGAIHTKPGSVVKENETEIVELVQIRPIDVSLSVPEDYLNTIQVAMKKSALKVTIATGDDSAQNIDGVLTFMDNRVDQATGTLRLKATAANANSQLWPGQFVNVVLVVGNDTGIILIPESAVQKTQAGTSVFVVKADQTVEFRSVQVKRSINGMSVIESGIAAGEIVVTDGQLRLGPGAKVKIMTAAGTAADVGNDKGAEKR